MRKLLTDAESGDVLLWQDGQRLNDGNVSTELDPGADVGAAVAAWVRAVGAEWPDLRPHIPVPGVAWCPYGSAVALVWESGGRWSTSSGQTFTDWREALAHELAAWAEGDGEPFAYGMTTADILAGRDVVRA